jgi:hypothetical protein
MNLVLEYIMDLGRVHVDAWKCLGAVMVFALIVITINHAFRR